MILSAPAQWNLVPLQTLSAEHVCERGNHAYDHPDRDSDSCADRRAAYLGLQPQLGLRTRRRPRPDPDHCADSGADRTRVAFLLGMMRGARGLSRALRFVVTVPHRPA